MNAVHLIKKLDDVNDSVAKAMAYAWQLKAEDEVALELEAMKRRDLLTEEWRFMDAALLAVAGNALTSVTIVRYGGESCRVMG